MTPWQSRVAGRAAVAMLRQRHDLAMAAAWTGAALGRAKRMPALKSLLAQEARPRPATPEDGWAGMRLQLELYQIQRNRRKAKGADA